MNSPSAILFTKMSRSLSRWVAALSLSPHIAVDAERPAFLGSAPRTFWLSSIHVHAPDAAWQQASAIRSLLKPWNGGGTAVLGILSCSSTPLSLWLESSN